MDQVELAATLCKKWMVGTRKGNSKRAAWEHPQDVVQLISHAPEAPLCGTEYRDTLVQVAWLHDVIEDGVDANGNGIGPLDLIENGISEEVAKYVQELSKKKGERKIDYLLRLELSGSYVAKVVKVCDRICNLREGAKTMEQVWWNRYVGETLYFIVPMISCLREVDQRWLRYQLAAVFHERKIDL